MYAWSDLSKVKRDLWNKLHAVGNMMGQSMTNLAQLLASSGHHLHRHLNTGLNKLMSIAGPVEQEKPMMLA